MRQARHKQTPYQMNLRSLKEFWLYSEGNDKSLTIIRHVKIHTEERSSESCEADGLKDEKRGWKKGGQLDKQSTQARHEAHLASQSGSQNGEKQIHLRSIKEVETISLGIGTT